MKCKGDGINHIILRQGLQHRSRADVTRTTLGGSLCYTGSRSYANSNIFLIARSSGGESLTQRSYYACLCFIWPPGISFMGNACRLPSSKHLYLYIDGTRCCCIRTWGGYRFYVYRMIQRRILFRPTLPTFSPCPRRWNQAPHQ